MLGPYRRTPCFAPRFWGCIWKPCEVPESARCQSEGAGNAPSIPQRWYQGLLTPDIHRTERERESTPAFGSLPAPSHAGAGRSWMERTHPAGPTAPRTPRALLLCWFSRGDEACPDGKWHLPSDSNHLPSVPSPPSDGGHTPHYPRRFADRCSGTVGGLCSPPSIGLAAHPHLPPPPPPALLHGSR